MQSIELRPWADLVFHVLSHAIDSKALAASVYDPVYVAFAERHLGPASERSLGEDAAVIGRVLGRHENLARTQLVAQLFISPDQASRHAAVDLLELAGAAVVRPELARALEPVIEAAELLRVACELERDAFQRLPPLRYDASALAAALDEASALAPALANCKVAVVRSLRLRGRVLPGEIWIGGPDTELAVSVEHVVWQACHEATVLELQMLSTDSVSERGREHAALVLLAERARLAGKEEQHERWLRCLSNVPPLDPNLLTDAARRLIELARGQT